MGGLSCKSVKIKSIFQCCGGGLWGEHLVSQQEIEMGRGFHCDSNWGACLSLMEGELQEVDRAQGQI